MTLFCFLWTPLFYLFWRSVSDASAKIGATWALFMGAILAMLGFFLGSIVAPGGFGFSRWVSACVDIVALPAALPFIVCFIFAVLKIISPQANFTSHAFLWLIPVAAVRALSWSAQSDPVLLIGVPVLWTAIITGMGFFVRIIQNGWGLVIIPAAAGAIALPLLAATSWWAFFGQKNVLGFILLAITLIPGCIAMGISFLEKNRSNP